MSNTATIQIRLDPKDKKAASKVFKDVGLDISTGIKLYLKKVIEEEGVPFPVSKKRYLGYASREEYEKDIAWVLKHGKSYRSGKELTDAIMAMPGDE